MSQRKWLENFKKGGEGREKIINSIGKTGILLEHEALRIFEEMGFSSSFGYYEDEIENRKITKEIDIVAHSKQKEIKVQKITYYFNWKIIADCKKEENRSILIFEMPRKGENTILHFPLLTRGHAYLDLGGIIPLEKFIKVFNMPMITTKISDLKDCDDGKLERLQKKDEVESRIYRTCEVQLLPATVHYYLNDKRFSDREYANSWKKYFQKDFEELHKLSAKNGKVLNTIDLFHQLSKKIPINSIDIFLFSDITIPMIIVDKHTALMKVDVDGKTHQVKDINEIGYFVYLYSPSTSEKFSILGRFNELPIIICNIEKLSECVKNLTNGIELLLDEMQKNLNVNSNLFFEEMKRWRDGQ